MKFEIWQSVNYADCALGYKPGAPMKLVWVGEIEPLVGSYGPRTIDLIFDEFQRVDDEHMPPEGYEGRSLSVGDVVRIGEAWFSCELIGWSLMNPDDVPDFSDETYREAVAAGPDEPPEHERL
jgi:hypothetical protein